MEKLLVEQIRNDKGTGQAQITLRFTVTLLGIWSCHQVKYRGVHGRQLAGTQEAKSQLPLLILVSEIVT